MVFCSEIGEGLMAVALFADNLELDLPRLHPVDGRAGTHAALLESRGSTGDSKFSDIAVFSDDSWATLRIEKRSSKGFLHEEIRCYTSEGNNAFWGMVGNTAQGSSSKEWKVVGNCQKGFCHSMLV
jgi:hypothetical protein